VTGVVREVHVVREAVVARGELVVLAPVVLVVVEVLEEVVDVVDEAIFALVVDITALFLRGRGRRGQ
jgi:hypothetical protein